MLKKFIERPVLSTVVSIILLLLGGLSVFTLPITLFPDIAPPSVLVTATYPGANAEVVARSVATPLEESINGVENMTYMTSNSSNDGSMSLTVYFKQGTNPDIAAVNVQNRVSKATSQIPQEVIQAGISTQKQQNSIIMFIGVYSTDSAYDETFLQNYMKINLIPKLQRIPGVGDAQPFGTKDYSMRIWLKPERLVAYNLSPMEVTSAIKDQSLEAAPGRLGQSSKEVFEYVLKYKGKLNKNEDYENIILKANADGSVVRLKDVARVEFGSYTYSSNSKLNGHATSGVAVFQVAGSNANDILTEAQNLIKKFDTQLPTGLHTAIMYNSKEFLDNSIEQVLHTLLEAFVLVFIVVFIFLQDFRSTLIPAIAVPVAIIGTFFFLNLFGFTINLLTLFALVLAIGIVVDDAIVVVEAVHAKMESTGMPAKEATISAMSEISGAIVSITLVMAAVFIPVGFMRGPAGVFYRQFAFTLAIAILISALNALTLSPALSALFLKNTHAEGSHGRKGFSARFFAAFNAGFKSMTNRYIGSLQFLFRRKWITITALVVLAATSYWMMESTPSGFIPTEDQGFLLYAVNTPPGSSLDKTHKAMEEIDSIIKNDPIADKRYNVEGLNFITNANAAPYGAGFVRMKPEDERGPVKDMASITAMMTQKVATQVKDAHAFFFTFPTIQGFGNVAGFEFMLQDQNNGSLDKLGATAWQFIGALMQRKEIAYAFTTFASGNPQYMIQVDNDKAKQLNVSVADLMQTMQIYYGSSFVSDFNRFGKYYRVVAQADVPYRTDEASLNGIYVKNGLGQLVPVNQLITLQKTYGPETVTRNNLYNAVTINGVPKPGYSTGDAIKAIEETAAQVLPKGYGYEWTGMTREEKAAGSQIIFIFILSLVFVYFLLSAQYESYILPFAIVLSIPVGVVGVFTFLKLFGVDNNIYVQVSLIMLVGLLAKNAILIVEYAVQRRRAGMDIVAAALEASRLRLRPILMTSFAFIAGLLPLMRAKGASALGNRSIGTGAIGGMLTGVILGVFVVPVLFIIFQHLQERLSRGRATGIKLKPAPALTILALVIMAGLGSCKVSKDVATPAAPLPVQFRSTDSPGSVAATAGTDTASIGNLPWKSFFSDTDLQQLIDSAIIRNYDMQVALENIKSAQLVLGQAKLGYWPDVTASAVATLTRPGSESLNGITANDFLNSKYLNDYNANVTLSWEADIWGKIKNKQSKALAQYLQTEEARKGLQTTIVSGVAEGYYNLLMLDAQLGIARGNLALNDSTLRIIRLQYNAGDVTALGVQQAEAQELSAAELIPQLQQSILLQENALSILTGGLPDRITRNTTLDQVAVRETLSAGVPAALVSRRPDVRSSELALTAANAEVAINKAGLYPALVISPEGGWDNYLFKNWFNIPGSLFGMVVGGLTAPVFDRKKLKTAYRVSEVDREKTVIQFKQTVLVAVGEVSNALAERNKLKEQQAVAANRVDTLKHAIANANYLFRNGMANYLEVITAQSNVLQSELELASIKKGQLSAEVELYRSLGGGWN
jgi:hydrophobe/amphiphile efflux-1 (HAE1) family protein/NodT family efflux transporter outer membrane factor (OMF) lipoprotein